MPPASRKDSHTAAPGDLAGRPEQREDAGADHRADADERRLAGADVTAAVAMIDAPFDATALTCQTCRGSDCPSLDYALAANARTTPLVPRPVSEDTQVQEAIEEDWMSAIIPRWEWRTFGSRIRCRRGGLRRDGVRPASRRATSSTWSAAMATPSKCASSLMDIKILMETDAAGLQRWEPSLKAEFPLGHGEVRQVAGGARDRAAEFGPRRLHAGPAHHEVLVPTGLVRAVRCTSVVCGTPSWAAPRRSPTS